MTDKVTTGVHCSNWSSADCQLTETMDNLDVAGDETANREHNETDSVGQKKTSQHPVDEKADMVLVHATVEGKIVLTVCLLFF